MERMLTCSEYLLRGKLEGFETYAALALDSLQISRSRRRQVHVSNMPFEYFVAYQSGARFLVDLEFCCFGSQSLSEFHSFCSYA